jgi:GNAT superfamily N-acetyltransferase
MGHMQLPDAMATRDAASPPGGAALRGLALCPVTGSAIPAIGAMWERCSLATRIARFHAPVRDIPASYLKTVLADPAASVMAVREAAGDAVALASLIGSPGSGTAELGVLVEDAWQGRGIGRQLTAHLITATPARGITTLTASVLAGNAQVADLLRQVPGQFSIALDGEALNVQARLACRRNDARTERPASSLAAEKGPSPWPGSW